MVVLECCCCRSAEDEAHRSEPGVHGDTRSSRGVPSPPRAIRISRRNDGGDNDDDDDSDYRAVKWIRHRSIEKNALSEETSSSWLNQASSAQVDLDHDSESREQQQRLTSPQPKETQMLFPDQRTPVNSTLTNEVAPTQRPTSSDPQVMAPQHQSHLHRAISPVVSDVGSDVDSISKERYAMAVKLLHRTLIQKQQALTPSERDFLQQLLSSSQQIQNDPSVAQLSAIESATQTLDTDPLFDEPIVELPLPQSPTESVQRLSAPRPSHSRSKKPRPIHLSHVHKHNSHEVGVETILQYDTSSGAGMGGDSQALQEADVVHSEGIPEPLHVDHHDSEPRQRSLSQTEPKIEMQTEQDDSTLPFLILETFSDDRNRVLTTHLMEALRGFFPYVISEENFWLKFSLLRDGHSLQTLLQTVRACTWTIIGVETTDGDVFGSFTGTPWRKKKGWFGSGEAFLWRLKKSRLTTRSNDKLRSSNTDSEMEVYPYTGSDDLVQYCPGKILAVGGGDWVGQESPYRGEPRGIGFMIDGDLAGGETNSCATFANPRLCQRSKRSNEFNIANLEVWTLTPCISVEEAKKLELHKLFVEENRMQ